MKIRSLLLLVLTGLLVSGCVSTRNYKPVPEKKLDAVTRLAAFDYVWKYVNEHYYDPQFNGVDWAATGERYKPLALNAKADEEFWKLLDYMVGELRDAHTRVVSPRQAGSADGTLGVTLAEVAGKISVERVMVPSEAWLAGVRVGMTVLRVNDRPALEWWRGTLTHTRPMSTERARQLVANTEFNAGKIGDVVRIKLEKSSGRKFTVALTRNRMQTLGVALPPQALLLSNGLGYLQLNTFDSSSQRDGLAALESLRNTKGIIIDLRNNPGGSVRFVEKLLAMFLPGETKVASVITRDGKPVTALFGLFEVLNPEMVIKGVEKPLTQPLVLLLNRSSASASELLSGILQNQGRAKVVGEESCGCLLAVDGVHPIPGGGRLKSSMAGFALPDGRRIEGVGVIPDIAVPYPPEKIMTEGDPQFAAAVDWLLRQLAKPVQP